MDNKRINEQGITMLTLTITIVIMAILAGIIMVETIGNQGILNETNVIKDTTTNEQNATAEEIGNIKSEWGNVLNQNIIENEINDR